MSFHRALIGMAAPIVGGMFGPVGMAVGTAIGAAVQKKAAAPMAMPGAGPTGVTQPMALAAWSGGNGHGPVQAAGMMPALGALPAVGGMLGRGALGAAGFGAGVALGRGRAVARAAGALCLKHPAWCSSIGGTAAIAGMMQSGQMPVPRRRRGRGITPRDLRSFRRVASLVRGFCPTVRRIPTRAMHARKTNIVHA